MEDHTDNDLEVVAAPEESGFAALGLRAELLEALDDGLNEIDDGISDDTFSIAGLADLTPGQDVEIAVTRKDGTSFTFTALCRIDTANELEYYRNGGILHYVLRKLAAG